MTFRKGVDREISTDVLVVGGAGAGVMAAVACARAGVKTTLVGKGRLGRSGNTIMAAAMFGMDGESAIDYGYDGDGEFTKDMWFEEIVRHGFYLSDQKIVEKYVENAAPLVKEVVDWGQKAGQLFHFIKPGNFFTAGKAIGLALRQGIKEHPDIESIEDIFIADLLTADGRLTGAVGVDVYTGDIVVFKAKAVILGTGGYQPFSFKCTVSDMSGDGPAMAFRAGLPLADMEFPLFIPGVCLSPPIHRGSIFPSIYNMVSGILPGLPAPIVMNSLGEDITAKIPRDQYNLAVNSHWVKLIYMVWWGKEIAEGRGSANGGVYLSFEHVSENEFAKGTADFLNILSLWYKDPWKYQGDDFTDFKETAQAGSNWEVGLGNEYSNGGILVDENAATELPGLFAAGECSTGTFGAYRSHRALVEMLVQGSIAGQNAARYVGDVDEPIIDPDQLDAHLEVILAPFSRNEGTSPTQIGKELEDAADNGFGFLRNEEGLKNALTKVESIKVEKLPNMFLKSKTRPYNPEWIEALATRNLALCLETGLRAALERRESRGSHIRSDYPIVDHDRYLARFVSKLVDGKIELSKRKPRTTRLELPTGKVDSIMKYALSAQSNSAHIDADSLKMDID
ncbi:MAG: FAD-binding protein [Proteobacteria bacterium]|nr:FAD-binding protein [Pseudomonadota bacterium]